VVSHGVRNIFSKKSKTASTEEFWALKDLNFEIQKGDRVGIIGRNGAGKSTLLKILSRITEPTTGRITIDGRVASLLEVGTGFHPELTGRENIFLNGAILGMSRAEIRSKFDEIVAFAEVEKFLDTPVKRYSSGMYVRLAFAVAAHLEPEILIVDEVLAVGDAQFQKKCLTKMQEVSANEGRTVLFVSHNLGVVAQLCNRGILLDKGHVRQYGNSKQIVDLYIDSGSHSGNFYFADNEVKSNKNIFFNLVLTLNQFNKETSDYSFNEKIVLAFEFTLLDDVSDIQIGIGLQDKLNNRVFTILKELNFFERKNDGKYFGRVELPANTLAPNLYSFVFALWVRGGKIYDLLENICPIKIHDIGTEFAAYEGIDYGNVIIKPKWLND